jgi:hypothetical protein
MNQQAIQLSPTVALRADAPLEQATGYLRLEFSDDRGAVNYASALLSLFSPVADELIATDVSGRARDDLDLAELKHKMISGRVVSVRSRFALESGAIEVTVTLDDARNATVRLPIANVGFPFGTLWLQSDFDFPGPVPVLALSFADTAIETDALHGLVALAALQGALTGAKLYEGEKPAPIWTWVTRDPPSGARPLEKVQNGSCWRIAADDVQVNEPVAWCLVHDPAAAPPPTSPTWWTRFAELTAGIAPLDVLESHLRSVLPNCPRWRLVDLSQLPPPHFMVPPEEGLAVVIVPTDDCVVVGLDVKQSPEVVQASLLHALAHVALGHVRPGDRWAHWDTTRTVADDVPHRAWDREAKEFVAREFRPPLSRRVSSLEECTPVEKAQLGLWRMIGEMLGESRRLHPAAERYQRAAYQRQGAQRLVSMLEDYGGAMLCDGVGLGKTYVATTLMVHYANTWRERETLTPDRFVEDPFRITIIAPHSVVSTWRREALPGMAAFGVPLASVRVLSHTQLSRVVRASELLEPVGRGPSDLEHLLLSDLVIVDEAHNFRSLAARRTKVLRDLLRVQPRRELRRRVVLLTATPINNSLEDLQQEVSLLFSRPIMLSDARTVDGYRRNAVKEIQDRCAKARAAKSKGDVAPLVVHGKADAQFSERLEFRDDLNFGPNVQRIGDYLKEQDKRLKELQDKIRVAAHGGQPQQDQKQVRIAEDLLDRIVVQRSRALCKEIERQQSSTVELLFRPDAGVPEKLRYSDEYDGIEDVLAGFLPLFDASEEANGSKRSALSFKVYMWYDVREGIKTADDTSSVIGLQRVLVLKRLESSPVSFLITLLRLAVLHAHRLQQLGNLCLTVGDKERRKSLQTAIDKVIAGQSDEALAKIRSLATGEASANSRRDFLKSLSAAYTADRAAADPDDPPPQLSLLGDEPEDPRREEFDRLWTLADSVLEDFETLIRVTPGLADIVFGKFERAEWPHRFIAGGDAIDWPTSPAWGQRLVTDAKIRQLVARLLTARRAGQKVVVFSQFSDTIAYIQSVLGACTRFSRTDWQVVVRGLGLEHLRSEELTELLKVTETITGATEDRDEVVNAFAPYYRIGPMRPVSSDGNAERRLLDDAWELSWTGALSRPIDVLLSTDVLAEGVNLQDAALLINYDVHWNPVRMIQRAGRIDRRLNPRIENGRDFADLTALAARLNRPLPQYYWHEHANEPPVTVNMILPDELEEELLLRERIATKTLAIDFTLGLERGTGAEADWMASYKYQGITSLNSLQKDRAIEQIGGHHERLSKVFATLGVRPEWAENLNGWFRGPAATEASPLVGRALIGRRSGDLERFTRYLEPTEKDGVPYWFWAEKRPGESMFDGWLILDGRPENFPPHPRRDIPFNDNVSMALRAAHLLGAAEFLSTNPTISILPSKDIGRPLMQGASALSAPKLGSEEDRRLVAIRDFFLLQLPTFDALASMAESDRQYGALQSRGTVISMLGKEDAE